MSENQVNDSFGGLISVNSSATEIQSSNGHALEQQHLELLAEEVLELKLANISDGDNYNREIFHLRSRVSWLTAILILTVAIFGGTVTWLVMSLNAQQIQLARSLSAKTDEPVSLERFERLESQFQSLNQQMPVSLTEVKNSQEKLKNLETQVTELSASLNKRQQAIAVLAKALQEMVNETPPSAPAASFSPVPALPSPATPQSAESSTPKPPKPKPAESKPTPKPKP